MKDGTYTKNVTDELKCWQEHIQANFYTEKRRNEKITIIPEQSWQETNNKDHTPLQNIEPELTKIREAPKLQTPLKEHDFVGTWLTSDYAETEINRTLSQLKNKKHMAVTGYQLKHLKY